MGWVHPWVGLGQIFLIFGISISELYYRVVTSDVTHHPETVRHLEVYCQMAHGFSMVCNITGENSVVSGVDIP